MNAERLLALYDRVADAPDAIARLRRFVLDLAVRGRLVPQDPNDEPASELLKRIAAEKARLVKAGEIGRAKALPPVYYEPFVLPPNWRWVRMREIASDRGQRVPDCDFTYIDVTSINKEAGVVANPKILSKEEAPSRARKVARKGDVLFSCVRPYLLNVAVVDLDFEPAPIASTAFAVLNGHGLVEPRYIWIVLRSPFMVECVEESQRGQAYPAINDADFAVLPFPLPPLAEQQRIVAKVEELMALLDGLEAARQAREATRDRFTAATLARLTAAQPRPAGEGKELATPPAGQAGERPRTPSPAPDLATDPGPDSGPARFALDALAPLTSRPDQIKALRQTILNLAVRGKLVPRDPNDEPASSLVENILLEKKAGKQQSVEPDMALVDFSIPSHWIWQSLDAILTDGPQNGLSPRATERTNAPKAITLTATTSGAFDARQFKHVEVGAAEATRYWLEPGDLLFQRGNTRDYVGMAAIYEGPPKEFLFPDLIMRVRISGLVELRFVHLWCIAPFARHFMSTNAAGAQQTMPKINQGILRSLPLPLPPLAEQRRIVAKVEELMALCDQLEAALAAASTTRTRLLEALLHEALAPTAAPAELQAAQ